MSFSYTYKELRKLGKPVLLTKCLHKDVNCKNRLHDGYCCVKECVITSESIIPIKTDFRIKTMPKALKHYHQQGFKRRLKSK